MHARAHARTQVRIADGNVLAYTVDALRVAMVYEYGMHLLCGQAENILTLYACGRARTRRESLRLGGRSRMLYCLCVCLRPDVPARCPTRFS